MTVAEAVLISAELFWVIMIFCFLNTKSFSGLSFFIRFIFARSTT